MLYNKYRRQWLVFVVVVGGRRRYRGRVVTEAQFGVRPAGTGLFD